MDDSAVSAVALLRTERSLLPLTALLTLLLRYTEERAVAPRGPGLSYVIEESEKVEESWQNDMFVLQVKAVCCFTNQRKECSAQDFSFRKTLTT